MLVSVKQVKNTLFTEVEKPFDGEWACSELEIGNDIYYKYVDDDEVFQMRHPVDLDVYDTGYDNMRLVTRLPALSKSPTREDEALLFRYRAAGIGVRGIINDPIFNTREDCLLLNFAFETKITHGVVEGQRVDIAIQEWEDE